MTFWSDRLYDLGLNVLDTEATHLELCSTEPTTYTQATSTLNLGTKNFGAGAAFGSPAAGSPNGRQVTLNAVTDGTSGTTGNAGFWAVTDRTNSRLLAAGPLSSSRSLTSGTPWTSAATVFRIPAPT